MAQCLHRTFWVTLCDLGIAQGHKCCWAASVPSLGRAAERGSELHTAPELEAARGGEATASCEKSSWWQVALGVVSPLLETESFPSMYLCTSHCIPCAWPHPADDGDLHSPGPPHPPPTFSLQLTPSVASLEGRVGDQGSWEEAGGLAGRTCLFPASSPVLLQASSTQSWRCRVCAQPSSDRVSTIMLWSRLGAHHTLMQVG